MIDLFGNERRETIAPPAPPKQLDLIDAAAERAALASGRPKSQERARILAPRGEEWKPPTCNECGGQLFLEAGPGRNYSCPRCA